MATPARKPLTSRRSAAKTTPRSRRAAASTTATRRTVKKSTSTAKSVRSGSRRLSSAAKKSVTSTSAKSTKTGSKSQAKTKVTRTRRTSNTRSKSSSKTPVFISMLRGVVFSLLGVIFIFCIVWNFILPSVLFSLIGTRNILYVSDNIDSLKGKIIFAHFDKDPKHTTAYLIDGSEEVEVPNGYGKYAVGAVPSLLRMEQQSDETMRSIMSRIFEIPIDQIVMSEPLTVDTATDSDMPFSSSVASELRAIALRTALRHPSHALTILSLSFMAHTTENIQSLDSYEDTSSFFETSSLELSPEEKSCSIAVINTTGKRNLARDTAHLLEQNGVYVVREDSVSQVEDVTHLQVTPDLKSECEALYTKLAPFFPETSIREPQTTETKRYRADIVILLGNDVAVSTTE